MANIRKQYPRNVYGIIREEEGFCLCHYILNDEKRIKLIQKDPPEVLYLVLNKLQSQAYLDLEKESTIYDE